MQDQTMKAANAAKKLGIYLPATPTEFRERTISRSEYAELLSDPPEWLVELRRTGPHPRAEVARKLGVSASGLARAGVPDSMTSAEIKALLEQKPEWLLRERRVHAAVQDDNARIKADRAARPSHPGGEPRTRAGESRGRGV